MFFKVLFFSFFLGAHVLGILTLTVLYAFMPVCTIRASTVQYSTQCFWKIASIGIYLPNCKFFCKNRKSNQRSFQVSRIFFNMFVLLIVSAGAACIRTEPGCCSPGSRVRFPTCRNGPRWRLGLGRSRSGPVSARAQMRKLSPSVRKRKRRLLPHSSRHGVVAVPEHVQCRVQRGPVGDPVEVAVAVAVL